MPDASAVVTKVVSEHHAIRGHIKLAGDTVNDNVVRWCECGSQWVHQV